MSNTAPIVLSFQVEGMSAVNSVFDSVEKRIDRFEKDAVRSSVRGSQERVRGAKKEGQEVADAHVKATEQWTKARDRIVDTSMKWAQQAREKEVKAEQRAADEKVRAAEKAEREKQRIQERTVRQHEQSLARQAREESRVFEQQIRREETMRREQSKMLGGAAIAGVSGPLSSAGRLLTTSLTLGGGFLVADAMRKDLSLDHGARALAVSAYNPYGEGSNDFTKDRKDARMQPGAIIARARGVEHATGIDSTELVKGAQEYVKLSSDFAGSQKNLGEFAKLSKASGTDFTQLMQTAGVLRSQNPNLNEATMMNMLRGIIGQGKMGAVEFTDLAKYAGAATSSSSMYAGDQATNQRHLLGLTQIARRTSESPAEAATAVTRLGSDLATHADKIAAHTGINVRDKSGALKDPSEIVGQLLEKTGGDAGALSHLGIGKESMKLFEAELSTFRNAGGGAKGAAAVTGEMQKYEGAGYSQQDVAADFAEVMSGSAERIDLALKKLSEVIETKGAPLLEKFATALEEHEPEIEQFFRALAEVAEFMIANPWTSLFTLMEANILKSVAEAALGAAVKNAMVESTSLAMAGSIPLMAGIIGTAAATAIALGIAAIDIITKHVGAQANKAAGDVASSGQLVARLKHGTATPEEVNQAKELQRKLSADVQQDQKDLSGWSLRGAGNIPNWVPVIGGVNQAAEVRDLNTHAAALKDVTDAIQAFGAAVKTATPNGASGGGSSPAAAPGTPNRSAPMSAPSRGGAQ